ncbi:MAG: hypothetical protein ACJA1C_000123 [Crocinitomicaceae bacterium]|jgi:hypothetical protein
MKFVYSIFAIAILLSSVACSETKEEETERSEIEKILDKSNGGNLSQEDLERLIEIAGEGEATSEFINDEANFKITFPVTGVEESTSILIIDDEELEVFHYTANMQGKDHVNLAYKLDYLYLNNIEGEDAIKALFNEQRDYLLSATNAKLEFEKVIEKNNAPGRHLYLTIDDSNIKTHYKMYYKDGIFYSVTVVTEEGNLFNKASSRFFKSFEILD